MSASDYTPMPEVEAYRSPQDFLRILNVRLRKAYMAAGSSDPNSEDKLVKEAEAINSLARKLDLSVMKRLSTDAESSKHYPKLQELVRLLEEIVDTERSGLHADHYLYKAAKRIRRRIRQRADDVRKAGEQKIKHIKKEEKILAKAKEHVGHMLGKKV